MILDEAMRNGYGANTRIVVTQPRKISAVTLADRVAKEFGDDEVIITSLINH